MRKRLKRNTIKEAFDYLPSGVCFFDKNGFVVLCNHQMYRLIFAISGRDLQSLSELQELILANEPVQGQEKDVFLLKDGSVWRFAQESIVAQDKQTYTQVIASNVTVLYHKQRELEENNRRLEDYASRMRRLSANMTALVREEEALKMKMRVHNDVGRSLIATRQFLRQNKPVEELDLSQWENVIRLLKNEQEPSGKQESLGQLFLAARNLNIRIVLDGGLPKNEDDAELLLAVLWECMTNAVRHGGATKLYAKFGCDEHSASVRVTNNGASPEGTVIEGGGLSSLRIRVAKRGGTMTVTSNPEFELTVSVPVRLEEME